MFLLRDAVRSVVLAVVWCPSVCLSVTVVYCIKTAEDAIELLARPRHSSFFDPIRRSGSKGKPPKPELMSVTRGQCDARPTVTFPAVRHHRPLAGTKLYCLVTEAHVC